jgi:gluconate 2-dehydrogenase gamma chain
MARITRRSFVATVGSAGMVPAAALLAAGAPALASPPTSHAPGNSADSPGNTGSAQNAGSAQTVYLFFSSAEALFIEAACERLIPADESGPGALGAGVPNYLDKQLGGAWGAGERLYRSGPWQPGTPSQGYQLPFTPAELFHKSLRAILHDLDAQNSPFALMSAESQDAYLESLESGAHDLDGVPSAVFFDVLLKMTVEGFFSDPVYGGNRDMIAWRMIGFPGAYADYFETVDRHGVKFEREPMSLAQDGKGHVHTRPDIPATL